MSDWCGTACALHPHPAAHGMPARCAVGDGHLAALPAWLLCMAALLPSPLLSLSSTRYGGGEKKKEREREKGQPCASRTISTQMCALNAEWGMQQAVAHTHTHTRARAQLAGIPPSTSQHEEGVQQQTW